jgi:hypothetical protein
MIINKYNLNLTERRFFMSTTNILDLNNRIDELEKNSGGGGSADSAKRSDIATEFNTTTAYTAGCYVYHEGKLYQFNADHSAGAWDPTDVVEANVTDQIVSNASAIAGLTANVKMAKLWENPDPTQAMATDTEIAIDDAEFDLIAYVCFLNSSNNKIIPLVLTPKNKDASVCYADITSALQRRFIHTNGIVTAKNGYIGSTVDNSWIILYQIYGIKIG